MGQSNLADAGGRLIQKGGAAPRTGSREDQGRAREDAPDRAYWQGDRSGYVVGRRVRWRKI